MREEKFTEAYQVVKKIAKYFPANPDRLAQIVRLAIRTNNYEDMQMYYEIFTSLEVRTQTLINYIGAGMYVAGKHCLIENNVEGAMQFFDNIAVSCSEFTKFLRAVITVLVEHNMHTDAEKFLSRFDSGSKDTDDYMISDFLISARQGQDPGFTIKMGLELYNRKIRDYKCMYALIEAMVKGGYKSEKIKPYREEMEALYPDRATISA